MERIAYKNIIIVKYQCGHQCGRKENWKQLKKSRKIKKAKVWEFKNIKKEN